MNATESAVLAALRAHVEGAFDGWGAVYLDNAASDLSLTERQFAGYLSSLESRGLYEPDNPGFGMVRLA